MRRALLALAAAGIAVVGAACGGDDDAADATSEATAAATAAASSAEAAVSSVEAAASSAVEAATSEMAEATSEAAASSGTAAPAGPIKVGFLSNCEGPFGPFWEATLAGMNVALIEGAGATANGAKPSDGVTGATVNGVPIEINPNYGCSDDKADKALAEAKRLVEQEGVNILIGPLSGDEGIAVANYAKDQPNVTFINGTSGAQDTTLKVRAPNFFRFHPDGAQWSAGLGAYAYNVLGWRNVVTIGDDYSFPYTQLGGFIAEFCSMGGNVSERLWPALGETDYSSYIAQIPDDVDGFFLGVGGTGTVAFIKQYEGLKGNLGDKVMGGVFIPDPIIQKELGERTVGMMTAGPTSGDSQDPKWLAFVDSINQVYPDQAANAASVFLYNYYNATKGMLAGLEAVGGDTADPAALQQALAAVELDTPFGVVKLDENRQAIASNFLQQIVSDGKGGTTVKTVGTVPDVDQSFGGKFSPDTPPPDRENPACEAGSPPAWTSGITKEALGIQ